MRVRNLLFLMAGVALTDGDVAIAQTAFAVDGDWRDWGRWPDEFDRSRDVIPDTNSTVDIRRYEIGGNLYRAEQGYQYTFILRFMAPPFQGTEETTVEWLFDVSPDTTHGELASPWRGFRPDYRIGVTGRDGALTKEFHLRWAGGQWDATEGTDIAELKIALSGQWLEGAIPWSALGNPVMLEDLPAEGGHYNFKWGLRVSKGMFRDYVPDDSQQNPWRPFGGHGYAWPTDMGRESWGSIKRGESE